MSDQRSVAEEMTDLHKLAIKHSLYDAADWIERLFPEGASAVLSPNQARLLHAVGDPTAAEVRAIATIVREFRKASGAS